MCPRMLLVNTRSENKILKKQTNTRQTNSERSSMVGGGRHAVDFGENAPPPLLPL